MTATSWPSRISVSERSRMCATTPPGTSQGYGETRPTLIRPPPRPPPRAGAGFAGSYRYLCDGQTRGVEVLDPDPLQHVPVVRVGGDADLERLSHLLRHPPDAVGAVAALRYVHLGVDAGAGRSTTRVPQGRRQ